LIKKEKMKIEFLSVLNVFQILLLVLLGLATFYIFIFAFFGLFYKQKKRKQATKFHKMAVLIPGYKEDTIIEDVAHEALKQNYPEVSFDIVVIADSFQPETLQRLRKLPIRVIEVSFETSTKSKALNKAMEQLSDDYDVAVVLDADNVMETDFLKKINEAFHENFIAIQGHRTAKNTNTSLAILDAVSEEINNHIFRKGHRVIGLSSAIIGSGMAFRYSFFKTMMKSIKAIGGFDKEIELSMLHDGYKIEYLHDAIVYDEKVQKAEVFSNQRRRWLSAQLHYFRQDIFKATKALILKGNIDYFDKAVQFIQPPRILLLGAVLIFGITFLAINILTQNNPVYSISWAIVISSCVLAFLFSIPRAFYNSETLRAMAAVPKGMVLMMSSLLKIKGANKKFIHTQHGVTTTEKKK
jgi:cellulose synthase/poly-beta-1,6-N-acetylglucosamine synthase-like glycosyltransferase